MPSALSAAFPLLVATWASAAAVDDGHLMHRSPMNRLQMRQSEVQDPVLDPSTFPEQCRSICSPFITAHNGCNSITSVQAERLPCYCTSANGMSLKVCLDCLIEVYPAQSQIDTARSTLDAFNTMCQNYTLPAYSLSYAPTQSSKPPVSFPTTPAIPTPAGSSSAVDHLVTAAPSPSNTNNNNPFVKNQGYTHKASAGAILCIAAMAITML